MNKNLIYKIVKHGRQYKGNDNDILAECPECNFKFGIEKLRLERELEAGDYIQCRHCGCEYIVVLKPEATPRPD